MRSNGRRKRASLKILFISIILIVILCGCGEEIEVSKEIMEDVEKKCEEQFEAASNCAISMEEEEMISLVILVHDMEREEQKELGEKFARLLSERVSSTQGIKGPEDDDYGELYDYYSLQIIVAGEYDRKIAIGNKAKKYEEIVWGTAN